ncbi:DNA topoisomerase, partial [Vibrio alfacsensis]
LTSQLHGAALSSTHKAFNASKIEAHHAIIPTEKQGDASTLSEKEQRIYELVAKHFIGLFYPESVREKTTVDVGCVMSRIYRATQSTLLTQGWEVLFKGEHQDKPNA